MSKKIDRNQELDIRIERELSSVSGKRTWDELHMLIQEVAKQMNLSKSEVKALEQRTMAMVRYGELKKENEYLSRTEDKFAVRKINKNKLEMQRMTKIYANNEEQVAHTEPILTQKTNELVAKKQAEQQNKPKTRQQTGK